MLMSDREALIRAVYAAPDDDAPRLIYADWLDEHDDPARAEFIRLQVELARLPRWSEDPRRRAAEERAAELQRDHQVRWLGGLVSLPGEWQFRRGFADELVWARHPPADLEAVMRMLGSPARVPPDMRLTRFVTHFPTNLLTSLVAEWPGAEHIRSLWLIGAPNSLFQTGVRPLAWSRHLRGLEDLDLDRNELDSVNLRALATTTQLPSLRRLNLSASPFPPEVFGQFLAAPHFKGLTDLGLNACGLRPEQLAALARLRAFPRLTAIRLAENHFGPDGAEALVTAPFVPELRTVDLSANEIGDDGTVRLAEAPWDRLEYLDLTGNDIGEFGALALSLSKTLSGLKRLILRRNPIPGHAAAALAKRFASGVLRL